MLAESGTARTKPAGTSGSRLRRRISSGRAGARPSRSYSYTGWERSRFVRVVPEVDERYMADGALLELYGDPEMEQVAGFGWAN